MTKLDDATLIATCVAGNEAAWDELVERYGALIWSIPRRYGLRQPAAEDVFADVCLALVRSLKTLRDPATLPQWIIKTTTRATWDVAKKESRQRAQSLPESDLPALNGAAPPDAFVASLEAEHLVRGALRAVSGRCRQLLEMLYFRAPSPSYDEIAAQLDIARGSIGPTRRRCMDKMRTFLPPELAGDVSNRTKGAPSS